MLESLILDIKDLISCFMDRKKEYYQIQHCLESVLNELVQESYQCAGCAFYYPFYYFDADHFNYWDYHAAQDLHKNDHVRFCIKEGSEDETCKIPKLNCQIKYIEKVKQSFGGVGVAFDNLVENIENDHALIPYVSDNPCSVEELLHTKCGDMKEAIIRAISKL